MITLSQLLTLSAILFALSVADKTQAMTQ